MNHQLIYNKIIEKAKPRGLNKTLLKGYFEKHHIIPRSLKGGNNYENLVLLTAKEHFICHALLCYIYKGNYKILHAFHIMSCKDKNLERQYKINSNKYSNLKEEYAKFVSKQMKNKVLSQETRNKMSKAKKGKKPKPESVQKTANKNRGKKRTKETREKLSKINKGKVYSKEYKLNMSEVQKNSYKNNKQKLKICKESAHAKYWEINISNIFIEEIFNLSKYCKNNNLYYHCLKYNKCKFIKIRKKEKQDGIYY